MNQKSAISKINKKGLLLVFPINNKKEPESLWNQFFPRKKMKWEWDDTGDNHVFEMWSLMKNLSDSGHVVYSKWYQGRATFFSKELFTAFLCVGRANFKSTQQLSRAAREIFETLESDSPLSTKQLKKICELQGKDNERIYNRAMKELFTKFLIVAYGEVDDGAFPSLAVGSTGHLFEDLLLQSQKMKISEARALIDKYLPEGSLFLKFYEKTAPDLFGFS